MGVTIGMAAFAGPDTYSYYPKRSFYFFCSEQLEFNMILDVTTIRWGVGRRADSDFAREQILDAALRCYQEKTAQKTRMEHIAREAKVSRTTIYRYFQNRDEVLTGVVLRGLHALVDEARDRIPEQASFADFLVEALASLAEQVPHSPVFNVLLREASAVTSSRMAE